MCQESRCYLEVPEFLLKIGQVVILFYCVSFFLTQFLLLSRLRQNGDVVVLYLSPDLAKLRKFSECRMLRDQRFFELRACVMQLFLWNVALLWKEHKRKLT